jgi:predicted HicB family RNase H-like nuclease
MKEEKEFRVKDKKKMNVYIDEDVWREFKILALKQKIGVNELLNSYITKIIEQEKKKN